MKSSPSIWHYVVSVKSTVKTSSIFVAFLENTNFKAPVASFRFMKSLPFTAILKKFEILRPFSRPLRKLKKSCFALENWTEHKKSVCDNHQCFAFQIQILTTKIL